VKEGAMGGGEYDEAGNAGVTFPQGERKPDGEGEVRPQEGKRGHLSQKEG